MTNMQKIIKYVIGAIGCTMAIICLTLLCKISFYAWLLGIGINIGTTLYIISIYISIMKNGDDNEI